MPLNKAQLITDLGNAYDATLVASVDAATAKANFVTAMANAIDAYVKTAKINYTSGLAAGATAVTGTFTGTLS